MNRGWIFVFVFGALGSFVQVSLALEGEIDPLVKQKSVSQKLDVKESMYDQRELSLIETDFLFDRTSFDPECSGKHNSKKEYTSSQAAVLLLEMLERGNTGMYSRFSCDTPYSPHIPEKAQAVYQLSPTWTPRYTRFSDSYENAYVQCVTFVFMSFQMAGNQIQKLGRTHAFDLLDTKYTGPGAQFVKHQIGKSHVMIQEGDVMVWSKKAAGTPFGHVGIVIETVSSPAEVDHYQKSKKRKVKSLGRVRVANANSNKKIHEYRYVVENDDRISLEGLSDGWGKVPDFWLRKKVVSNEE